MIKRQIKTDPNADPNETSPFDWSCCCICEKGADLRFTDDGIEVLAKQFVAYRKNDLLPFNEDYNELCSRKRWS